MTSTAKQTKIRQMHPNSLANLEKATHWKPGQSGNPTGRQRHTDCLLSCIKDELAKTAINGQTNEQLIAAVLIASATRGNIRAVEVMMSYLHAKPTQGMDVTSKGEKLTSSFVFRLPDGTSATPAQMATK